MFPQSAHLHSAVQERPFLWHEQVAFPPHWPFTATLDKLQHCLWGWLGEAPHRLELPVSFLFPSIVIRVREDWSWLFVRFVPLRHEVYSLDVWLESILCWWQFFLLQSFFVLKSSHRRSLTVTHELLLEYTLQTNLSMCLSASSSGVSTDPNLWNVPTISSVGVNTRNFVIHAFLEMLKNFPPQSAPVKLCSPINALYFSDPMTTHLSLTSIVR